jgi:hypothetical protein
LAGPAEEVFENVTKRTKPTETLIPTAVVLRALRGIRKHIVGVGHQLEAVFRAGVAVHIGV